MGESQKGPMMKNGKAVTVTVEEGNILLNMAHRFACPDKLGDEAVYSVAERSVANAQVGQLHAELKSFSPLLLSKGRWHAFGPRECWKEWVDDKKKTQFDLVEPEVEVTITLNKDAVSGAIWCLLALLHPKSSAARPAGDQYDILWPLARKFDREGLLREEIGLPVDGMLKGRWDSRKTDEDYRRESSKEEKK